MNQIEKVAQALAKADGLDFDEVCGVDANPDDGYCDSGTCVAAHWEEHDAEQARRWYMHLAQAAIAAMPVQAEPQWQGIESAPRDGTKAILYFPQYATDFDGVDYSYSLAIYRKNSTFPLGTWCDQGTNHDSFEGPDMTGCDKASHWMPLPTPPAGGSDAE